MRVIRIGERYSISTDEVETYDLLPVKTYVVLYNEKDGFYLTEHTNIEVREKIYGVYENKVNKVLRAFEVFQRSLGTILSGDKGIGKSIFAKLLCQKALEYGYPVLIVDEAYIDFGGESALPLIEKYDNLIVVQTFSKSRSMAGSRIGFAISNEKAIKYLNDVKYSFNSYTMDALTIELGTAAIEDREYFELTRNKIIETREWTKAELKRLGFHFGDSMSNFIFASHAEVDAGAIFEELKKRKIFVRYWNKPRINNHLRITIGTKEEMNRLFEALTEILEK